MRELLDILTRPIRYVYARENLGRGVVLAILASLLGFLLAGCDGAADEVDARVGGIDARSGTDVLPGTDTTPAPGGLRRDDAGNAYCDVPSPTGDAVNRGTGRMARQEVALELATASFQAFVVVSNAGDVAKICGYATSAKCSEVASDFAGSDGVRHCWILVGQDGETCRPSLDGKRTCKLSILGNLDESAPKPRATAACSADGVFVGWWCNNGPS